MFVEKNTFGQWPVWTSALTSVPTAPPSSGRTCSHDPVANPGVEICAPAWVARALLCTCHPPRPTVVVRADAAEAPSATTMAAAASSASTPLRTVTLITDNSLPLSLASSARARFAHPPGERRLQSSAASMDDNLFDVSTNATLSPVSSAVKRNSVYLTVG